MAVPKRKTSRSRRNTRRAHDGLKPLTLVKCSRCNSDKLPHAICDVCGYYRGKPVIAVEEI